MKKPIDQKLIPIIVIIGGGVLLLISFGIRHSFGLYLLPITNHLNTGREVFGFAAALQVLMIGIGSPLFGALSDKFGSGKASLLGITLVILGLAWMANLQTSFDIIGAQALCGLGSAGCGTAVVLGAVGRSVKVENRTLSLGIVMAAGSFGQFAVVPFTGYLIELVSWSQSLVFLTFFAAIMIIFSFALNFSEKSESSKAGSRQTVREALKEAFQTKSFNLLTLGFFVCGFHVTFVAVHLPAFIEDENLPFWVGGWALALIGLFNIIGTLYFGYLGDRLSKKNLLALLYSLRSLLFLVFIFLPKTELTVLLFACILGILWLSTVPLTSGIITVVFGPYYMSMLYGIAFFSHQIGSFLGSWLGGRLFDAYGSYNLMWWICVALGFISALLHMPIKEKAVQRLADQQI
ncbi:MAG: MFS transporter [Pelagibacteraceae bacterium]|jgi:predicted MFS family arabinose efflux permease|nr:MFS transporter [Pelagibacteraceae bacterium]MDP6784345.1 MFS transporter [Alphaproteobacteria bacterium]MBO6468344.1 MFS transporter [Pelagibacteraceae bacterium]MBO6469382.1 MFS transporter [Pelagibacteraceae bacterium]MBO6470340.1 MFS transporter [Pelagibacteraceae bacterium]